MTNKPPPSDNVVQFPAGLCPPKAAPGAALMLEHRVLTVIRNLELIGEIERARALEDVYCRADAGEIETEEAAQLFDEFARWLGGNGDLCELAEKGASDGGRKTQAIEASREKFAKLIGEIQNADGADLGERIKHLQCFSRSTAYRMLKERSKIYFHLQRTEGGALSALCAEILQEIPDLIWD